MKRFVPLALASLALLAACGGGSSDPLAHKTPGQVLTTALAAAKASGSFHLEVVAKDSGQVEKIVGGTSGSEGSQTVTSGAVTIHAEVFGNKVYLTGNAAGLEAEMSLSASVAATYANRWIDVGDSNAAFQALSKSILLTGALNQLHPTGSLTLTAPTTRASQSVIGVRGGLPSGTPATATGSATLYVARDNPTVPIVYDVQQKVNGSTSTYVGTYSDWGQPLHLAIPTHAVALSSLPSS
jgi:hypothetical protein